jgi:hypothetical protein
MYEVKFILGCNPRGKPRIRKLAAADGEEAFQKCQKKYPSAVLIEARPEGWRWLERPVQPKSSQGPMT